MVIAGDARSDSLDILQPANLTTEMVLGVRILEV